jgi:hypothetical protein
MAHLIQIDGIIKEYKPEDLPNGCVISGTTELCKGMVFGLKEGSCITAYPYQIDDYKKEYELDVWGLHAINDIKIHDIINPETEESTHQKMWLCKDERPVDVGILSYDKPFRMRDKNKWKMYHEFSEIEDYLISWEDEPRPVWIEIPKDTE